MSVDLVSLSVGVVVAACATAAVGKILSPRRLLRPVQVTASFSLPPHTMTVVAALEFSIAVGLIVVGAELWVALGALLLSIGFVGFAFLRIAAGEAASSCRCFGVFEQSAKGAHHLLARSVAVTACSGLVVVGSAFGAQHRVTGPQEQWWVLSGVLLVLFYLLYGSLIDHLDDRLRLRANPGFNPDRSRKMGW